VPHYQSQEAIQRDIKRRAADDAAEWMRVEKARALWRESVTITGTWAEEYLGERGLAVPKDPEIRERTLRFHPNCPFPDGAKAPALLVAFTRTDVLVPNDPFYDDVPHAIHRIRGRGHDNKAMLGPVKGSAMMLSPWWQVHEHLHITEGIETALSLFSIRPIWAMGSAGGIERLPVIERVLKLYIWADHDDNGTGLMAARKCRDIWNARGKDVVIHMPDKGGDYAERR
jgi:putative DNA primase/helicase